MKKADNAKCTMNAYFGRIWKGWAVINIAILRTVAKAYCRDETLEEHLARAAGLEKDSFIELSDFEDTTDFMLRLSDEFSF